MLKITTRLDHGNEEKYIELAGSCMNKDGMDKTISFVKDFDKYIRLVVKVLYYAREMDLLDRLLKYYKDWKGRHPSCQYRFSYKSKDIKLSRLVMAWLVMPYDLMQEIHLYVKIVCGMYLSKDNRWKDSYSHFSEKNVNNWIIGIVDNKVCPYCNLSFIYNRSAKKTTAELDHFYCKSQYPLFALNYYNLIPVCHSCNHIKHEQDTEIVSPYDENAYDDLEIDWTYIDEVNVDFCDLENNIEIKFNGSAANKKHLELMHIKEAYDQHKDYAAELIQKIQIYNNRAARELLKDSIDIAISAKDVEAVYFGKYRELADKRILGKMTKDFLNKHLEI